MTPREEKQFKKIMLRMGSIPMPLCAFCKKLVRKLSARYSTNLSSLIIEVECHGDKHLTQVPEEILNHYDSFAFPDAFSYGIREDGIYKTIFN